MEEAAKVREGSSGDDQTQGITARQGSLGAGKSWPGQASTLQTPFWEAGKDTGEICGSLLSLDNPSTSLL